MYSQHDFQNFHNHIASVLNVKKEIEHKIKEFVTSLASTRWGFLRDRVTFFSTTIIL